MNDGLDMYFGESLAHFEKAFGRQLADRYERLCMKVIA